MPLILKNTKIIFIYFGLYMCMLFAKNTNAVLTISQMERNETVIIINSQTHIDYGLAYPVTYEFSIPNGSNNLKTYRKFKQGDIFDLLLIDFCWLTEFAG